jgi:diketogulonate reductase-like aldo/keto reductase
MKRSIELKSGIHIPVIGFGTFKIPEGEVTFNAVLQALKTGYRHIDTAEFYGNEASVGKAIAVSKIDREELFVTTKVWNSNHGYKQTLQACKESLSRLNLDYLDLYLIHWPKLLNIETWHAMEELYSRQYVRAIGVSNFKEHHLEDIIAKGTIVPMINQVELHPRLVQHELVSYCASKGIVVEAWSPLMRGKIFELEGLVNLAKGYHKDAAQVVLRWHLQRGRVVLPKSVTPHRINSNFDVFDFSLSEEDLSYIDSLDLGLRIGPDPDFINF